MSGALRRGLVIASTVEIASLSILLLNRPTLDLDAVASLTGPVHGTAYLVTIALAMLSPIRRAAKVLAWVPVVGGLLALRASRAPTAHAMGKARNTALADTTDPPSA